MIHAIIFAKQNGVLDFYQSTPRFPAECMPQIRQVCQRVGAGYVSARQDHALRYAPVRGYGMLQVMLRDYGNEIDERRVHWSVVTYLLEQEDAFRFFLLPFRRAQRNALDLSNALLRARRGLPLPEDLGLRLLAGGPVPAADPEGRIPDGVLLRAAFYGRDGQKNDRLFIQTPGDPALELERLLEALPPFLRRDISFHTGVCFPEDSYGVSICCCPPPLLERLEASGFNGCEAGNIFFHYPEGSGRKSRIDPGFAEEAEALLRLREQAPRYDILQYAIRDWDTFRALGSLREGRSFLRDMLRLLRDEDLQEALRIAGALELEPLSKRELKLFLGAARGKTESRRSMRALRGSFFEPVRLAAAGCAAALLLVLTLWCSSAGAPALWKTILASVLAFLAGYTLKGIVPLPDRKDPS